MKSILECSSRTVSKILLRLKLGCFECGWDECICDLHHIIEVADGGTNDHGNLTYLCPNCHRKAHNGLLKTFKTLEDIIGDQWKLHYNPLSKKKQRVFTGKVQLSQLRHQVLAKGRASRSNKAKQRALEKIKLLRDAKLDTTTYGWVGKAADILDVAPQRVIWYLRKYQPDFLIDAKIRKPRVSLVEIALVA